VREKVKDKRVFLETENARIMSKIDTLENSVKKLETEIGNIK
jgi:hypothetical protein